MYAGTTMDYISRARAAAQVRSGTVNCHDRVGYFEHTNNKKSIELRHASCSAKNGAKMPQNATSKHTAT